MLQTNLEMAAANAELQRKLQAAANTMKLMAAHAGVQIDQVSDWVYAQQLGQEQLQDQADAEAGVELTTRPSTSTEHVEGNLTKMVKDTTKEKVTPVKSTEKRPSKDKSTEKRPSKDKYRTPKGGRKEDPKTGSNKSKKPRLEESLKEQSTKELYNAYLKSQKKDKAGKSGTQNAGCSPQDKASPDKRSDQDSDADPVEQNHGAGEDDDNRSSNDSWEDHESEAGSQIKVPRTSLERINKRVEDELEADRLSA